MSETKRDIVSRLQKEILQWEGYKPPPAGTKERVGLGRVEAAFPNGVFPIAAVHEFVCANTEQATACGGFITTDWLTPRKPELMVLMT